VKGVAKPTSVSAEVELQKLIKDNLPDVDAIQAIDKSIGGLSGQTAHICVLFVVPQALAVLSNPTKFVNFISVPPIFFPKVSTLRFIESVLSGVLT
jgi:hypothetical protein